MKRKYDTGILPPGGDVGGKALPDRGIATGFDGTKADMARGHKAVGQPGDAGPGVPRDLAEQPQRAGGYRRRRFGGLDFATEDEHARGGFVSRPLSSQSRN